MNRCGFVHMESAEMAENAIRSLNNTSFKGITISVEPGRMKRKMGKPAQETTNPTLFSPMGTHQCNVVRFIRSNEKSVFFCLK